MQSSSSAPSSWLRRARSLRTPLIVATALLAAALFALALAAAGCSRPAATDQLLAALRWS